MTEEQTRLEAALVSATNNIDRINALNAIASQLGNVDNERGMRLANEAEKLSRLETYTKGLLSALINQMHAYRFFGDYAKALKIAYEALPLCEELHAHREEGIILRSMGFIYGELGDYPKGLEYHLKTLALYETLNDIPAQALTLVNIGIAHSIADNPKQAIEYYQRSIELDVTASPRVLGRAYNSCCVDYITLGDYEQAKSYGEKAIALFKEVNDQYGVGVALSSLGEVALACEDFADAIQKFEQALPSFQTNHGNLSSVEALETLFNLGQAHYSDGNSEKALGYVQTVLSNADGQSMQRFAMKCHQLLSRIYEQQQDFQLALSHLKQYTGIREKTLNETSQRQINNLQILHETREAQAASERQKKLREQDRQNFERLTQIKNDFLHSATHDIKNPLSGILMSSYLLAQTIPSENEKAHEYIKRLNESAQKIRRLVEDILDLARLETVPSIYTESVAVTPWFDEILNSFKTQAEAKAITLHSEVKPLDLICKCNKQRMGQALENLISNAIKYTQNSGEIYLKASQQDQQLQLQVVDNGMGIPKEALPHIFDRFYRVNKRSTNVEGTGLGLSIVKLCVEQHGGEITVMSKPHKGSTFTIMLRA
jgi:signal transduction histidine kinase